MKNMIFYIVLLKNNENNYKNIDFNDFKEIK